MASLLTPSRLARASCPSSGTRTAIVGPLCLLREGIKSTLRRSGFELLLEVSDIRILTAELWSFAETCSIFVVLSHASGDASTGALVEYLLRRVPACKVVVLGYGGPSSTAGIQASSAVDFLPLMVKPDDLIEALRALANRSEDDTQSNGTTPDIGISRREWDVLKALSLGESNKHIARRLGISDATVKAHVRLILKKTRCGNRTQAVLWALDHRHTVASARGKP